MSKSTSSILALKQIEIEDKTDVDNRNKSYADPKRKQYHMHTEMGPCPFEGDIDHAPVVLLLSNPGYDSDSKVDDHRFHMPGWPFSGLHPYAPDGMRIFWQKRLRELIKEIGDTRKVSLNFAALQLNPWASERFDDSYKPPSQNLLKDAVKSLLARKPTIVIGRSRRLWFDVGIPEDYEKLIITRSPRCSYLSKGNLGDESFDRIADEINGTPISLTHAVKKSDWKAKAMPQDKRGLITLGFDYSLDSMDWIRLGHYPDAMDDRWFMYFANDTLFIHRSWTGYCIYMVRFIQVGSYYCGVDAIVNRDPKQYKETDDSVDTGLIRELIDDVLLRQYQ